MTCDHCGEKVNELTEIFDLDGGAVWVCPVCQVEIEEEQREFIESLHGHEEDKDAAQEGANEIHQPTHRRICKKCQFD